MLGFDAAREEGVERRIVLQWMFGFLLVDARRILLAENGAVDRGPQLLAWKIQPRKLDADEGDEHFPPAAVNEPGLAALFAFDFASRGDHVSIFSLHFS